MIYYIQKLKGDGSMAIYSKFTREQIDAAYINALVNLINACRQRGVELNTVSHYQNGWLVTFKGYSGDAICHDGSYGSPNYNLECNSESTNQNDWSDNSGAWETIGFPWDGDDVSVHDVNELAYYLHCLNQNMAPWEAIEEDE